MVEISRLIKKNLTRSPKSCLLLGPRQTGKSTLIRGLEPELTINLMDEVTFLDFTADAGRLRSLINASQPSSVFIDEIQRIPSLLNTIQVLIDELPDPPRFYLTGSSARKLKRGAANLLPGRLFHFRLGPLACNELDFKIDESIIAYGSLPEIYTTADDSFKAKLLTSYTGTYLKEEIQAEALSKNLEGFSRFLHVVASESTKYLDLSKLAQQAQINRSSAVRWFEILEDTLLVHRFEAFTKNSRKRLVQHPRFIFFDNGILNALLRNFEVSSDRKGVLFENMFASQLMTCSFAQDVEILVSNFRSSHGAEVDFIIESKGEVFAVECKSSKTKPDLNLRGFKSFSEVCKKPFRKIVAYMGSDSLEVGDVSVLPWQMALREIL